MTKLLGLTRDELYRLDVRPIVISSHQRSGTHLTIDLLRRHFPECASWKLPGQRMDMLAADLDRAIRMESERAMRQFYSIVKRVPRPIIKTHRTISELMGREGTGPEQTPAPPEILEWLRDRATFCYAARDGREVMASYHLYRQSYDPSARCTLAEFLRQDAGNGRTRAEWWRDHVQDGIDADEALLVPFHKTVKETAGQIEALSEHLGLKPKLKDPLLPKPIRNGADYRLARFLSFRPVSTANPGRQGRPKKWRELFGEGEREYFGSVCGEVLIRLGCETSTDWANPAGAASKEDQPAPNA